jgi:murein endopeptidase
MRRAVLALLTGAALCACPAAAQVAPPDPDPTVAPLGTPHSVAAGKPWDGFLEHGVQLPEEGADFVTWDQVLHQSPNRGWRRWGTQELLTVLETVTREFRAAHPGVPRVLISDLSRPQGGEFGRRYGGLGHASHQNGLDVDVMYPRRDGLLRAPIRPSQVDRALAQDLVDRFLRAGAVKLFVGPHLHLRGPRDVVVALTHHDDHVHVRIPTPPGE